MSIVLIKTIKLKIMSGIVFFIIFIMVALLFLAVGDTLPVNQENTTNLNSEKTSTSIPTSTLTRQPGMPKVTLRFIEPNKTAQVAPGETGVVTFNLVVNVTKSQVVRIIVSLTADDTWSSAVVEPSSLLFSANGEKPAGVSVRVGPGESCNTVGTVTVKGYWTMYPGGMTGSAEPESGVVGNIYIAQYYKFSLHSSTGLFEEVKPGSDVEFDLTIRNEGNGLDSFFIEIENLDELSDKDIEASLSESMVVGQAGQNRSTRLYLEVPENIQIIGSHEIKVQVTSEDGIQKGLPPQVMTYVIKIPEEDFTETTEFSLILAILIVACVVAGIMYWRRWKNKLYEE
jgi:hypothetical protein